MITKHISSLKKLLKGYVENYDMMIGEMQGSSHPCLILYICTKKCVLGISEIVKILFFFPAVQ